MVLFNSVTSSVKSQGNCSKLPNVSPMQMYSLVQSMKEFQEFYVFHYQLKNFQFSAKIFLTFLDFFSIFDLRALADGPIESVPLISWLVGWLVSQHDILKAAVTISQLVQVKLGHYRGLKLTRPDFQKKILWFID